MMRGLLEETSSSRLQLHVKHLKCIQELTRSIVKGRVTQPLNIARWLKPIEKIFSHCFKLSVRNKAFELGLSISAIEYCRQHSSEVRENHLSAIRRKALHKHELHNPQADELTKYLELDIMKRGNQRMPTKPGCHKKSGRPHV